MDMMEKFEIITALLVVAAVVSASYLIIMTTSPTFIENVEVTNVNLIGNRIKLFTNSSISPIFTVQNHKMSLILMQELIDFNYENGSCYLNVKWRIYRFDRGHELLHIELLS